MQSALLYVTPPDAKRSTPDKPSTAKPQQDCQQTSPQRFNDSTAQPQQRALNSEASTRIIPADYVCDW
ncbi:MAG: hypothetical protein ACRC6V_04315 [Bacteroidales bacterium]